MCHEWLGERFAPSEDEKIWVSDPGPPGATFVCPARQITRYVAAACRLIQRAQDATTDVARREGAFLAVLASAAAAEAFVNVFFRCLADSWKYEHLRAGLLDDLERRSSLEERLREWPQRFFGKAFDLETGVGRDTPCVARPARSTSSLRVLVPQRGVSRLQVGTPAQRCGLMARSIAAWRRAVRVVEELVVLLHALEGESVDRDEVIESWTGKPLPPERERTWESILKSVGGDVAQWREQLRAAREEI
jgi:hypothetical protein